MSLPDFSPLYLRRLLGDVPLSLKSIVVYQWADSRLPPLAHLRLRHPDWAPNMWGVYGLNGWQIRPSWSVFEATFGPLLVFVCAAFILYGIFVAQLYYYYISYEGDTSLLKLYVWIMGLLETSHTALCVVFLYWYLIVRFGNAQEGIERIHWSIRSTVILEILMVYMAQVLYCWRIWHVSGKTILITAVPFILSSTRLVLGLTSFGLMANLGAWQMILDDGALQGTLTATYAVELAADASISALLVYGLWKRRTTKFARTNEVIQRLVFYILNTGVSNIICSAAVIITFNLLRESLAFAGIIEMRSKLYANIMMALLNSRQILFTNRNIELPTLGSSRNRETHVHIFTDTIVHDDSNVVGELDHDVKPTAVIRKSQTAS